MPQASGDAKARIVFLARIDYDDCMLLERKDGKRVLLWVVERRGSRVWVRTGHEGTKGRISCQECASDEEAEQYLQNEVRKRIDEGYHETSAKHGIDRPLVSAARRAKPQEAMATVKELVRQIDNAPVPCLLGEFITLVGNVLGRRAMERLTSLSLEFDPEDPMAWVEARFSKGSGENPDDYDHTDQRWALRLTEAWPDEEGVLVDAFSDGVRGGPALAARFIRAVDQLRESDSLKRLQVIAIEEE